MGLSGVQRPLKFAKYLPDFGWQPIILTSSESSYYSFDDSLAEELDSLNLKIYRTPGKDSSEKTTKLPPHYIQKMGRYVKSWWKIPDSKSHWRKPALKLADKIIAENEIEAIYTTAPPYTNFLIGRDISLKYNLPLTIDYRDSWIDNKFHFYPTAYHKNKAIKMETSVINAADKIVMVSRFAKELLIKRYKILSYEDVNIIPHGYDPDDFALYKELKPNSNHFTLLHFGSFLDDRTPKYLFKAAKNFLKKNKEAKDKLKISIIGASRKNHEKMPKKYGLQENVVFSGYIPHRHAVEHLFTADVLWLMLNDDIRTPGKLYEYFGTRKPLLITAPDGNMKELAKKTKACLTTLPDDVKEIEKAITTYYRLWKEGMLPKGDEANAEKYNRKNLTGELAKHLNNSLRVV